MSRKPRPRLIKINRPRSEYAKLRRQVGAVGEARVMKPGWTIFLLSAFTFGVAFGAAWLLVPDVVPISHTDEPQAGWAVLTAFLLRAIELTAAWVALIALAVTLGAWTLKRSRQPLNRHPTQPAD
jgi:hypothetical protein